MVPEIKIHIMKAKILENKLYSPERKQKEREDIGQELTKMAYLRLE